VGATCPSGGSGTIAPAGLRLIRGSQQSFSLAGRGLRAVIPTRGWVDTVKSD